MYYRPTMLAAVTMMVSCAPPEVTNQMNEKDPKLSPADQLDGSPEIAELEDLKNQIELFFIPAFQSLYFKLAVDVKYSTGKKMATIRKRLKKAKTYLSTRTVVLMYLQKYQNHLQHLKKFELVTDVNILDPTLDKRQYIWKNLEEKQTLAVTEISESIEIDSKEGYRRFKTRKDRAKPLLRFKSNGGLSDMTQNDIYYLNHFREFLDYSITHMHQKRKEKKKKTNKLDSYKSNN